MAKNKAIDYRKLYNEFVAVLETRPGTKEDAVIHAIVGFEFGGPPDVLLFKQAPDISGTFYVTSDLLFCEHQPKNSLGRYEVAICLPEEREWAEHLLFKLSHATLEEVLDVGHTADITAWVENTCAIKGLLITQLVSLRVCEPTEDMRRLAELPWACVDTPDRSSPSPLDRRNLSVASATTAKGQVRRVALILQQIREGELSHERVDRR
jgi:hypothetical protein